MVRPTNRGGRRTLAGVFAVALIATILNFSGAPAQAHTRDQAILYGCGSGYSVVSDGVRLLKTPSGLGWGYVYLTYNPSNGYNCVVTRKATYHGTPTRTMAILYIRNTDGSISYYTDPKLGDDKEFSHWAAVKHYARGKCVKFRGYIYNPSRSSYATGYRGWGNCGS